MLAACAAGQVGPVVEGGVAGAVGCGGCAPSSAPSCLGRRHQSRACEVALPSWLPHAASASSGQLSSATAWAPQADLPARGRTPRRTSRSSLARPTHNRQPPVLPVQLQLFPSQPWSSASGTRSIRERPSVSVHLQGGGVAAAHLKLRGRGTGPEEGNGLRREGGEQVRAVANGT